MTPRRILITGASGCIGHYVTEALIQETNHELFLLVRNPGKLQLDTQSRPGITVVPGDMREIRRFADLLKTVNIAVLAAADWGGTEAYYINVSKTLELLDMLDPATCEQVLYFSTSSVLDQHHRPLKQAGELGTDYIRSKYDCLQRLPGLAIAPRVTVLFPTLVLGGDGQKPNSFLLDGLPKMMQWINVLRFFKAEGSFHIIHGRDIAQVIRYLIDHPPTGDGPRSVVLGQEPLTVNQAIEETCAYLDRKIYFRIPVSLTLVDLWFALFRNHIPARDRLWDRFCLKNPHFTFENPVNPTSFGLPNYCATLSDVLNVTGIPRANGRAKSQDRY